MGQKDFLRSHQIWLNRINGADGHNHWKRCCLIGICFLVSVIILGRWFCVNRFLSPCVTHGVILSANQANLESERNHLRAGIPSHEGSGPGFETGPGPKDALSSQADIVRSRSSGDDILKAFPYHEAAYSKRIFSVYISALTRARPPAATFDMSLDSLNIPM